MTKSNSYVYFALTGEDFEPQEITRNLGVEPSEFWRKGEKGNYNPLLKYSCWKISTVKGKEYSEIDKLVNEIVELLFDKIDEINELKEKLKLNSVLEIVIDIDVNPDKSTPAFRHNLKTIEFLYKTKTETDVDIYRFNSLENSTGKSAAFTDDEKTFQQLDWSILQNGWVSLYLRSQILKDDLKWFKNENYNIVKFECKSWTDETEMHKQLKQELHFPDYYGENFDALNDCLSYLEIEKKGQIIVFNHIDKIDIKLAYVLLDVFANNSRRHMLFGEKLIVLAQVDNPDFRIDSVGGSPVCWNKKEWLESNRK